MRVIIDVNGITDVHGGLSNYVRLLVANLAEIDAVNEYVLYLHQWTPPRAEDLERVIPRRPNFRLALRRVPNAASLVAERRFGVGLTEMLLGARPGDVFHGPSNVTPLLRTMKSVVSIHHYLPVGHPLFSPNVSARARMHFAATEDSARAAARVVAISENTRRHLIADLGVSAEKISVVYPGGPHPTYHKREETALWPEAAARLPGPFVLFPGPVNERKNVPAFLEAFAAVQGELAGVKVAFTSIPDPEFARTIAAKAEGLGLGSRVVFLGAVSDERLAILYSRARCLAYPSLFEGFGAPPLEAMACGCPVIASNVAAIPEVTAGAALLFDPADTAAMGRALVTAVQDEAARRDLIARGFQRVKDFSWRKMAQELLAIYQDVARATN